MRFMRPFLICTAFSISCFAGPINVNGDWYEFHFNLAPSKADTCVNCPPSSSAPSVYASNPPWTFTAAAGGAIITVTDAFLMGDRFNVFIDGGPGQLTSAPAMTGTCLEDVTACLANPDVSHGFFAVGSGAHSFSIDVVQNATATTDGAAFFRVADALLPGDEVPEPSSMALLSLGAIFLGAGAFRRSAQPLV